MFGPQRDQRAEQQRTADDRAKTATDLRSDAEKTALEPVSVAQNALAITSIANRSLNDPADTSARLRRK